MTGRQLSACAGIPQNYLSKILLLLAHAGLIQATRGNHGGYELVREPGEIRLADVVDLFDNSRWRRRCFLDSGHACDDVTACAAHTAWLECRAAYERFLETTTISELAGTECAKQSQRKQARRRAS